MLRSPFLAALLWLCALPAIAADPVALPPSWPQAPQLPARAWVLLDASSVQVLAEHNADEPMEPASLTKLMTAYLVFTALQQNTLQLEQTLPVSRRAQAMEGSRMFIAPGMQPSVEQLLRGMIVQSGNDATIALAEGVAGSVEAFVERMNAQAAQMGLTAAHFANPEGMPAAEHKISARDLAQLAARLIADFPQHLHFYSERSFTFNRIRQSNRNPLLGVESGVDGLKTGHTESAGYNFIVTAEREESGLRRRLIAVILGTSNEAKRAQAGKALLDWGYSAFVLSSLIPSGKVLLTQKIFKGTQNRVQLVAEGAVLATAPRGQVQRLRAQAQLLVSPVIAPLAAGQRLGELQILYDTVPLKTMPLVAQSAVAPAGFFGSAWDALLLKFKRY